MSEPRATDIFAEKIVVVTVTYGDRSVYVSRLLERIAQLNIKKIVLVDNNSSCSTKALLDTAASQYHNELIDSITMAENVGSAKAFKAGLIKANQLEGYEYILLLDDDNLPDLDLIEVLESYWTNLAYKHELTALACNRVHLGINERVVAQDNPWLLLGKPNSFLGFHVGEIIRNTCARLFKLPKASLSGRGTNYRTTNFAPYGGLFFHKSLLEVIGYPNEDYVIYADDCEFTYRIPLNGGMILALLDAKIYDMDDRSEMTANIFSIYANIYDKVRLYYTFRNAIHFHLNQHCNNKTIFICNLLIYYAICVCFVLSKFNYSRLRIFYDALLDGISGNIGEADSYTLADVNLSVRTL
ncbi:glycosyltransferase, putative [Geobacter metallireducens GS-15]|uniref:Glycosyltransferase, putative n=1 Tax=Geobacter metallireducens (strain ATCC 53774 / DSM 7210 / GS-15) TaxID=269799 RepID=Q39TL6_GEOMG|nr:glycosyltransferase [Geobacter metallireducens]ABB32408.1 glycosyltransferase, putative [Geobacter metallireducens GS-15]